MVNLSALNNISTLEFNNTIINDSRTMIPNLFNNANNLSEGYFGLGVMVVIFIFIFYEVFREDGLIRLDFLRAVLVASGFVFIIGFIAIVSGLFTSYLHVIWFLIIFLLALISLFYAKKSGF